MFKNSKNSRNTKTSTPAPSPEEQVFEVNVGAQFKAVIAVKVRAATQESAENQAKDVAKHWCTVAPVEEDDKSGRRRPPRPEFEGEIFSYCSATEIGYAGLDEGEPNPSSKQPDMTTRICVDPPTMMEICNHFEMDWREIPALARKLGPVAKRKPEREAQETNG